MRKSLLPIGITAAGIYSEARRLFDAPRDGFELQRGVHLMLFSKIALQEDLLSPSFCVDMQKYFGIEHRDGDFSLQKAAADTIFKSVAIELMTIFTDAMVDLSVQVQEMDDPQDKEDAHFSIGMAEVTLSNFGKIISGLAEITPSSREVIEDFFTNTTRFAVAMKLAMAEMAFAA